MSDQNDKIREALRAEPLSLYVQDGNGTVYELVQVGWQLKPGVVWPVAMSDDVARRTPNREPVYRIVPQEENDGD